MLLLWKILGDFVKPGDIRAQESFECCFSEVCWVLGPQELKTSLPRFHLNIFNISFSPQHIFPSASRDHEQPLTPPVSQIKYKTLSGELVAILMIAEVVSNSMLSLPSSLAVVGVIPGLTLIIFLGVFATYTSYLLVQSKLRHQEVHNTGDDGLVLFGPFGRELLASSTIVFAVFATGGQPLAGQIALGALSDSKLCLVLYTGIFAIPTLLCSFSRTLGRLSWLSIPSVLSILVAGIAGMISTCVHPMPGRELSAAKSSNFYVAFVSITKPIFAYAEHFMFFILVSEMRRPQDAIKAAYTLQGFATTFYAVFAVVVYVYAGDSVASPAFSSLERKWMKAAYGITILNFRISGSLYAHTAS